MSENVAITHLAECESDASYVRKCKMTPFIAVSSEPKKSRLCQMPSDKESEIISFLQNYCEDKPIVWSAIAKQFNITITNGGHMVKQLAVRSGLNVESLQRKKDISPRNRVHKKRISDSKVPVPCMPSLAKRNQEVSNLIDNGTLYLGEPYSIYRYKWVDSNLDKCEYQVYGRKMNFDYLRHKLFKKHKPYMQLTSEDVISKLFFEELSQRVSKFETIETNDRQYLMKCLKNLERTRHLSLWHDHSVVLSRGYILVTLSVIFDEAVFDVSLYDERKHGVKLQEYVEQPEIYMICMSSSSVDDQAAIIPDRLECLSSLSQPLISGNGVEINDVLCFFVGDHKAIAFEQGAQCGGNFPCGTCGIHVSKFTDRTHALRRRVRSLQDIQNLATSGRFGKRFNVVRPFGKFNNMSMDNSTTQLVSTPKPSIGIADDDPHNPMDVAVPSDLEGDHVVVGYVDNDAQQPKECFQNTEVDLKTSCGRVLLELLGHSDSLKRIDTVRYQLKIKKKSHLALPVSDKALHDTLLAQFHCKVVAKVSSLKKDIKKLEIMHFKENNCVPNTEEYIHLLKLHIGL